MPRAISLSVVREQAAPFLEESYLAVCAFGRKTVAVAIHGADTGIPKFGSRESGNQIKRINPITQKCKEGLGVKG